MKIAHCRYRGPAFVGGGLLNGALPRSDTLSAAIISHWCDVSGSLDDATAAGPPFRISSALPTIHSAGRERELLVPLPPGALGQLIAKQPQMRKEYKRVQFASLPALKWLQRLDAEVESRLHRSADNRILAHKRFGCLFHAQRRPRLMIDRIGDSPVEGMLFQEECWFPGIASGFAILFEVSEQLDCFVACLRLLGLSGVGANRSTGMGQFDVEQIDDFSQPDLGNGARMLLSLCWPRPADISAGILRGAYEIIDRRGWVTSPFAPSIRKGGVRMLGEGGVYPTEVGARPGGIARVVEPGERIPHAVFRDGRSVTIEVSDAFSGGQQ